MPMKGNWEKSEVNSILQVDLRADDPNVFDQIVAYAYQGKVVLRSLNAVSTGEVPKEANPTGETVKEIKSAQDPVNETNPVEELAEQVTKAQEKQARRCKEILSLVKLYIVADKLNMEQCVNDIIDQYLSYLQFKGLDPYSFEHLITFGPPECELQDLLVAEMACEARLEGFEN